MDKNRDGCYTRMFRDNAIDAPTLFDCLVELEVTAFLDLRPKFAVVFHWTNTSATTLDGIHNSTQSTKESARSPTLQYMPFLNFFNLETLLQLKK